MSVALVYAAEAYHTLGAMRHVVGDLQMHSAVVKEGTTVMDYWASMMETRNMNTALNSKSKPAS